MRTAIRRPRINRKPSKGLKMFLRQKYKAAKKLLASSPKPRQRWYSRSQMRENWLSSCGRSYYTPHQGSQEKSRRVRQMANGTHGYPQRGII